jgi:hypothetical protein
VSSFGRREFELEAWLDDGHRSRSATGGDQLTAELSPQEVTTLLRIADGSGEHDIEEAAVSRLQTLELVEQRGVSLGLTLRGVQKVARLRRC